MCTRMARPLTNRLATSGDGQFHDSVSHSGPSASYTKTVKHSLPDGKELKAVAGTQSMDGWWTHGKRNTRGVNARYEDKVEDHIREEQWRHWLGERDRWLAAGEVISWVPESA